MAGERQNLHLAGEQDPIWRLWSQLPEPWRGPVIGDDVEGWESITENDDYRINLTGLPEVIQAELAWMAHWQAADGTRSSVLAISQLANILREAIREDRPFPPSIRQMDWEAAAALQAWFYASRWRRFPPHGVRARLRVIFRFARTALIAACHDGHWWELDYWHPRCDQRIPLSEREPQAHYGCSPALITHRWLREAVKWYLGTMLESGALRWTTVSQERLRCLHRFDRWLAIAFDDPREVLADPATTASQAAAFRRWDADPANRSDGGKHRRVPGKVRPRLINDDLRAVAELFAFIAANQAEARRILGPLATPWTTVTDAHAACWLRQVSRIPHERALNDGNYVDDHALAQITAALPLLGLPRGEQTRITRGDGEQILASGFDDPQAMRMILLQILTGRRSSEIRHCEFGCLSPATGRAAQAAQGEEIARFRYAQTKIDIAPDTILVDSEVVAIIEEQQRWVRDRFPGIQPRHLFLQLTGNRTGAKPYPSGTYTFRLREFSKIVQVADSKGRPVRLSHTHRFRHTKFTRLAELGLPVHVLQRYAGHYAGDLVKLIMLGDCLVEAGQESVEDFLPPGLALGGGVVALLLEGGAELDGGLEEGAGFADRLEVAVQPDGPGAVAVAEHALVHFGAELAHLGALGAGGQVLRGVVEGLDLLRHREVLLGHGAVGDAGIHHGHPHRSMSQKGGYRLEAHAPVDRLGGQRVPEPVRADVADPGGLGSFGDGPVDATLANALAVLDEEVRGAQAGGPCGEPAVQEVLELGVQRDIAVGAQLAERHVQPVGGADLHDGVDGKVEELAFAQAGAGQELHGQADERVGVGAGSLQQLGERAVVQEPGQRLVAQRQVAGEDQHRGGDIIAVPLGEPLEAGAQGAEVLGEADPGQFPAASRWPGSQVQLVGLDVAAAKAGDAGDLGGIASQPAGELAQHALDAHHGRGPQRQAHLGDVAGQGRCQLRRRRCPLRGPLGRAARAGLAGSGVKRAEVEQGGLQSEQRRAQRPRAVAAGVVTADGGSQRLPALVNDRLGYLIGGQPGQRRHLGQRRPLQAGHGSPEAEPGGGFSEAHVERPVMMSGDFPQVGPAGHQVVGARAQPPGHDEPSDHPPVFERQGALVCQGHLRPPGGTDAGEEHAGDRGNRMAGEHPGRHQVGAVGADQVLDAGPPGR
jgi:integrase